MRLPFDVLQQEFYRVLLKYSCPEPKAAICARIFAENSRDGVYSHGLNRFPVFAAYVRDGWVDTNAELEKVAGIGVMEQWDGHLAPGMYCASRAMERAIFLARQNGIGAVALKNSNHWMRGGTYGWQAADAGCIALCMTNTIANMPPWGGISPRLGNNPLIIAVPRKQGHVVLDMAMSQYSYGKLQEYALSDRQLPFEGGYDPAGNLTKDAAAIMKTKRVLPAGLWKGSGLSLLIDMLVTSLSDGRSTAAITESGKETGLSQFFLCIHRDNLDEALINEIISFTKEMSAGGNDVQYPGERTLRIRKENEKLGIPVNEAIWQEVCAL